MDFKTDYSKYRSRKCNSLHECAVCKQSITLGQMYHDGGYGRRAHVACVHPVAPPKEQDLGGDKRMGLYRKYNVTRLTDPRGKHTDCEYFVLDWKHDPFTIPAMEAYSRACAGEYPELSASLHYMIQCYSPPVQPRRGYMGGGTVGGGDPDDADREPECEECRGAERPCAKCVPTTPSLPMTEGARLKAKEAIRRLRERADEMWLDTCVDAHGMGQECAMNDVAKPALAMLHTLCSAIETHPLDRTNEYVENARKRARDFLEANGHE